MSTSYYSTSPTDAAGVVLPVLELVPVAPEEGTFEGELIRESISYAPRFGGAAVFKRDRLVGFFSPTEARGRQWVLGKAVQAIMTVPHPHSVGKQVFGLRTHTNLVLPLCGLVAAFSIAYCRQETVISDYLEKTRPLLTITATLFVLGLLILSHLIKWSRRLN